MLPKTSPEMLDATYNLMALAHETAMACGKESQAAELADLVANLRSIAMSAAARDSGVVQDPRDSDFEKLLRMEATSLDQTADLSVRSKMQSAQILARQGVSEINIARKLGVSREEVRLILTVGDPGEQERSTLDD